MELLRSFLRRLFAGKLSVASQNVIFFRRLIVIKINVTFLVKIAGYKAFSVSVILLNLTTIKMQKKMELGHYSAVLTLHLAINAYVLNLQCSCIGSTCILWILF